MLSDKKEILAQKLRTLAHKNLRWLVALSSLPLFGMVTAFGIAPQTSVDNIPVREVVLNLALPLPLPEISPAAANATFWRQERIQRGDTVASLLTRLEVKQQNAQSVISFLHNTDANKTRTMHQLVPGKAVHAQVTAAGELLTLRYAPGGGEQFRMEKTGNAFNISVQPVMLEKRTQMKSGVISSSLFAATDEAGVPDNIAIQIAEIFASDIDFHRDLRKGDRFTVVYETLYGDGEPAQTGRVLAVEFVNDGKTHRAVYFQPPTGNGGYYAPDGKNLRKAFLRSPLEFSRISSGFSRARFHPVLKTWRAHRGVDYAAPTGTKVRATANGSVAFVGSQSGYGNLVVLQHQGKYTTAYGHLSAFAKGLRKGQRVNQGDTIGRVGATGLATGPHLHYEFRVNGDQRDPLRVVMPAATPIASKSLAAFHEAAKPLLARLEMLRDTNLASLD